MEIIRGLHNLRAMHRGNVVTIGNFDGVHLGHQAIIKHLKTLALKYDVPATLITFHPNPLDFFAGDNAPPKLSGFRDKMQLLQHYGVDRVICIPFNQTFADLNAETFITDILLKRLHTKHLVIGDDFQFGKNRQGDFHLLQQYGEKHHFTVENTDTFLVNQQRASSTLVRQTLTENDLTKTHTLLGRPYHVSGKVSHGDKRGRTIGFPTANIRLKQQIAPTNGVYAVKITGLAEPQQGVANIGVRPTVDGHSYLLEIHLFDFNQDIYGQRINIYFEHFIRPEKKFSDLDTLVAQITQDTETAKSLLT